MTPTEFLEYFVLFYGNEKLSDEEVEFLKVLTQLDYSPFSQIQALKDFGNNLFRQNQFAEAGDCYDNASRLLSSSVKDKNVLDLNSSLSLAVSLCLNLAACSNKLQASEVALTYCSMVLNFFPRNAKTLFRKAVALRRLNRLSEACTTLEEANLIEPHNKDIIHELEAVKQSLVINKNGKRVVVESLDAEVVRAGKVFVSSPQDQVAGMVGKMVETVTCTSSSCSETAGKENKLLSHPVSAPGCCGLNNSPDVPMVSDNELVPDEASNVTEVCNSSSSTTSKSPQFRFTNKKRPHNTLHLSSQDYDSLLHGTSLGFYHPRSMSFLRVRTLISKTIQTGTPHDELHGTAEVPTSSPTPENSLHIGNIASESVVLVKEEADIQVDKKTRLNSDYPYPTKISSDQFEFAAVRDLSLARAGPIVHRYHTKDSKGCASATSKRRTMFSASFCRYTRSSVAVMRRKRNYVHLIEFDDHYHPPFKKIRLVSSIRTTCTFSSVTWLSSSFGAAYAPSFVF